MVSLFLLLGCNLSYIVVLFAALHELASASARTLLKFASSVRALLKPLRTILLSRERVNKGMKRMNSLPLSPVVISFILHDFTGKTAAYKFCVTL